MIMWMLMIMLSVVIMFFAAIMKMMMIMRMKMIMIVTRGDAGCKVDAIDLHLDTLQLPRHRDDQGANISADVEHDRALACVWILNSHLGTPFHPCPTDSRTSTAPSTAWWLGAVHEGH